QAVRLRDLSKIAGLHLGGKLLGFFRGKHPGLLCAVVFLDACPHFVQSRYMLRNDVSHFDNRLSLRNSDRGPDFALVKLEGQVFKRVSAAQVGNGLTKMEE